MKKILLSASALALLVGCFSLVPRCGDEETVDLVKEIARDFFVEEIGDEAKKLTFNVVGIRTTDENDKTGAYDCAADLEVVHEDSGESDTLSITYLVENTDKGDQFYVTVNGLGN